MFVPGVNNIGQTEMHAADPLVPGPSYFQFKISIEKLKWYESPGMDQIPAELIQARGNALRFELHKHNESTWNYL
jgi:hypothetical protein